MLPEACQLSFISIVIGNALLYKKHIASRTNSTTTKILP